MAAANVTTFIFSKMLTQAMPYVSDSSMKGYMANVGLTGDIGGYKWDLSYVNSLNSQETVNPYNMSLQNAYAALDANMMKQNPPWAPLVFSNDRNFLSARFSCVTINEAAAQGPLLNMACLK